MIEAGHEDISVRRQCSLLGVARSGVYYVPSARHEDTGLANNIHEIWQEMPFYGYRRITAELHRRGFSVNCKRVRRVMAEAGIEALYPRPRTTLKAEGHKIYPYLLRDEPPSKPDDVWATDITYIKLPGGFVYLVALIDLVSRYILAWRLSNSMEATFCVEMLEEALAKATPSILNTDQGSQFTGHAWIDTVERAGVRVSMDGKGRWADNVFIERFWRTVKHEHLRFVMPETMPELRRELAGFIRLYNEKRLHQSLGYLTPMEVYSGKSIPKAA